MMDLKRWVTEQQSKVVIDKKSQFLANFSELFPGKDLAAATKIGQTLQNYCHKVINTMAQQSVKQRFMPNFTERLVIEHG